MFRGFNKMLSNLNIVRLNKFYRPIQTCKFAALVSVIIRMFPEMECELQSKYSIDSNNIFQQDWCKE